MRIPFADIKPNVQQYVPVSATHTLACTESGNQKGLPVIVLHGGPGASISGYSRRLFDPEIYRIIQFDQRGCGVSTPHHSLTDNTTNELIEDISRLAKQLELSKWVIYGCSWGATLALLYAQKYPEHISGLLLQGTFLGRKQDIDWLYGGGAGRIFPDHWRNFRLMAENKTGYELLQAYHLMLTGDDELHRMSAAKAWSLWDAHCATLSPNPQLLAEARDPKLALPFAIVATYYLQNKCFLTPDQIIRDMRLIDNIPGIIIHGRYDMACPLENAFELYQNWSNSELDIVREAGHSELEVGITDAMIKATNKMAQRLGFTPDQA